MDKFAKDFAERAQFLFVYTREAHPERFPNYPPHQSIEQKYEYARDMQRRHNTSRPIAIDDLDGAVHRLYGGMPNMSWVIDHTGRVAYKAAWTVERDIRQSLEDTIRVRELKREASSAGTHVKAYYKETISIPSTVEEREADVAAVVETVRSD